MSTTNKPKQKLNGWPLPDVLDSKFLEALTALIWAGFIALTLPSTAIGTTLTNQLSGHPSKYLAMHGQDDIHWQQWSSNVLTLAQQRNRLIFISSGYFSCYWCHRMHQDNFADPQVAKFLNQHFINVKIDKELSPTLDLYLTDMSRFLTQTAGWPQHAILTPDGHVITTFVYLPRQQILLSLNRLTNLWQQQPQSIQNLAQEGTTTFTQQQQRPLISLNNHFASTYQQAFWQQLRAVWDDIDGGLSGVSKFPDVPLLSVLMQDPALPSDGQDWLITTLDHMQNQQLQDHIHGGFFRYTVDPAWQVPHFEKMLTDNVQLFRLYASAAERFQTNTRYTQQAKTYHDTAWRTFQYLQRHLWHRNQQCYMSSESAVGDTGEEGEQYVWSQDQLKQRLPARILQHLQQEWFHIPPTIERGYLPKPLTQHHRQYWPIIQRQLAHKPTDFPKDDKCLVGWNGLVALNFMQTLQHTHWQPHQRQSISAVAKSLIHRFIPVLQATTLVKSLDHEGQGFGVAELSDWVYWLQAVTLASQHQWLEPDTANTLIRHIHQHILTFRTANGWHTDSTRHLPGQTALRQSMDRELPSAINWLQQQPAFSHGNINQQVLEQAVNYPGFYENRSNQSNME